MNIFQTIIVVLYGLFSLSGFLLGLKHCVKKKNPYGLTHRYNLIGSFVWVDAVVFGLFWTSVSMVVLAMQNFMVFLLFLSLFWLTRSVGEMMYWFNQQFSSRNRNPAHTLWVSKIFPSDSSWVAMQIFWQCMAVVSGASTILLIRVIFK